MVIIRTDAEIDALIAEPKLLPYDYRQRILTRPRRGHREQALDLTGSSGNDFRLILRQALLNPLDFSIILAWMPPQSTALFRLRRYNGKSHEHSNVLEVQKFYDFHIHQATERYQTAGLREDAFAEPTDRYQDYESAVRSMIQDCGFQLPAGDQSELF